MRNLKIGFALFWTVLIPILCLMNLSKVSEIQQIRIPNIDKIVHFSLYATFAFLWMWSLLIKNKANSYLINAILIFILGSGMGIIIEFLQENCTQTRSAEILDVICNCSGILFGLIISKLVLK